MRKKKGGKGSDSFNEWTAAKESTGGGGGKHKNRAHKERRETDLNEKVSPSSQQGWWIFRSRVRARGVVEIRKKDKCTARRQTEKHGLSQLICWGKRVSSQKGTKRRLLYGGTTNEDSEGKHKGTLVQ